MHLPAAALAGAALAFTGVSAQLQKLAQEAGLMYFGTAFDREAMKDSAYMKIFEDLNEFGQITPGNVQKWQTVQPTEGKFAYEYGDQAAALAKKQKRVLRCHTLVWHQQVPSWVTSPAMTKEQLTKLVETHITNVVGHFKGSCYSWDVVNEAVDDKGGYRDSHFYKLLGKEYIPLAFKTAAAADPNVKLYYNDFNIENMGAKLTRAVEIVKLVKDAGAPIHGVGMQAHLIVGKMASSDDIAKAMKAFVDAGVAEVAITELDIRFSTLPYDEAGLKKQAEGYASVVKACLNVPQCVGITIWDFADKYSWIPQTFKGAGGALLYDDKMEKKPAWTAIKDALAAAAGGPKRTGAKVGSGSSDPQKVKKPRSLRRSRLLIA